MLRGNLVALQKNEAFLEQSLISFFFSHIRNDLQKQGIANNHSLFLRPLHFLKTMRKLVKMLYCHIFLSKIVKDFGF